MPSSWVFQANPKTYNVEDAIRHLSELNWLVVQHRIDVHTGDIAYIWKSGPAASLLCRSTVLSEPILLEDSHEESRFHVDDGKFRGARLRVRIRIDQLLNYPLMRAETLDNPVLASQKIFTRWQGTNFPLDEAAAPELDRLFRQRVSASK
jgi:hypothetical protein